MIRSEYNLAQWLEWMEKNHPTEIELGLGRVSQVFNNMQLDLSASKIISIAGTNGKGSTTALLEAVYLAAGYSTLAYTSPHLLDYNERVRLNAKDVSDHLLIEAFNVIDRAMGQAELRISLSYFEIGTLAAIYLVSVQKPVVALLEVGLGGRLDAVNIIDADVAVITTLAIDHVDWLGDDIEQIGREKAGIARANRPLVCGELSPPASIKQESLEKNIILYQVGQHFSHQLQSDSDLWTWKGLDFEGKDLEYNDLPYPQLPLQNATTALQVIAQLGLGCDQKAIVHGLQNAHARGRLQSATFLNSAILLDVAHNPQSAKYLASRLTSQGFGAKVHLVLGVLADKDCAGLIAELSEVVAHWHLVSLDVQRGQSAAQLQRHVLAQEIAQINISCYETIDQALSAAVTTHTDDQKVVVAGSFVTVSQALALL